MTNKISGVIQHLNEKDGQYGKSYNIKVNGTAYYLKGKYPPRGIAQGDSVEFEYETKGNFPVVKMDTLRKAEASAGALPPAKKEAFAKATSYDDRQVSIVRQSSLKTALDFLVFAQANDTLPMPKTKNAGYGYLRDLWYEEAARIYEVVSGEKWEIAETDIKEEAPKPVKKAAAKKAPPKPVEEEEFEDDELPDFGSGETDEWE